MTRHDPSSVCLFACLYHSVKTWYPVVGLFVCVLYPALRTGYPFGVFFGVFLVFFLGGGVVCLFFVTLQCIVSTLRHLFVCLFD